MKLTARWMVLLSVGILLVVTTCEFSQAMQRGGRGGGGGGGGARPSMSNFGGGGGRPSMGGGVSRPQQMSRPTPSFNAGNRPSLGNVSRPNMPTSRPNMPMTRPNMPNRPANGGFNPSGGGRPNISIPSGGAGLANRPAVNLPSNLKPTTRPSLEGGLGGGNRPTTLPGTVNRPGIGGNLPGLGGGNRPEALPRIVNCPGSGGDRPSFGNINRPTTLPGTINRPGLGGAGNRPGFGGTERPTTLPGNITRPGLGGNRPGIGGGNRPGIGDLNPPWLPGNINRPNIGVNRPGLGNGIVNGNNNISIGGGNVNIGNSFGNSHGNGNWAITLPAWNRPNVNRPDWGWGGGNGGWAGDWHNNCVNDHHGWYNGCWNQDYWGGSWYAPVAWGAVGWGLGSLTSDWGYGNAYYNPYYTAPLVVESAPYNYSQPVVVNNYISSESDSSGATAQVEQPVPSPSGLSSLDEGLVAFKAGNFSSSLSSFDSSLKELPSDPVVHEVRALNLFALGQYPAAAASLNSLLSSAPGMDWTTMSSLYGDVDDYASQLKKLEQFCEINANDAASQFVLAYHYLVVGEQDSAINALKAVVKIQPKDSTAKRMLDALAPPVATSVPSAGIASDAPQPNTDLVGSWRATAGTTTIDLAITEDSKYVWKAITSGQPPVEIVGDLTAEGDAIVLANDKQGSMAGAVRSLGADKWQFTLNGSPSTDPGLSFARVGK